MSVTDGENEYILNKDIDKDDPVRLLSAHSGGNGIFLI